MIQYDLAVKYTYGSFDLIRLRIGDCFKRSSSLFSVSSDLDAGICSSTYFEKYIPSTKVLGLVCVASEKINLETASVMFFTSGVVVMSLEELEFSALKIICIEALLSGILTFFPILPTFVDISIK